MLLKVPAICAFLTLILPLVIAHSRSRHHREVAVRARGDVDVRKRQSQTYTDARFTYYAVGLGACGVYNYPSDWIVALNVPQFGDGYPGPQCFKSITMQYGGKTAQATIMDECEACPYGGLDLSEGLFSYFADEAQGVIQGVWWYDDATTSSTWTPPSTTWEPPSTTSTPAYTPPAPTTSSTPAYTPPTTSSTPVYTPPPATSTTTTSSTSSTSSFNSSTGSASGLAAPSGGVVSTPNTSNPQNILAINSIMVEFGIALSLAEKSE